MFKLGIVGFGVVGKSAFSFFTRHKGDDRFLAILGQVDYSISVWDRRDLSSEELLLIEQAGAHCISHSKLSFDEFFRSCDKVLVSPGVDVRSVALFHEKLLCELDVFSLFFKKPVIAVTGSFGKTTTTALLGKLLGEVSVHLQVVLPGCNFFAKRPLRIAIGGNIGIGMLDLANQADSYDCAVLELSSWQLEHSKRFVPDIAVWTNLYPNHLDRHETILNYARAKYSLIAGQGAGQYAVLAVDILQGDLGMQICQWITQQKLRIVLTSSASIPQAIIQAVQPNLAAGLFIDHNFIVLEKYEQKLVSRTTIIDVEQLPSITFVENWLSIFGALYASSLSAQRLTQVLPKALLAVQENPYAKHRVEYFATIRGVDFYNDSKSTVVQTTQAAVKKLTAQSKPIIIILGGLSKGADRSSLIPFLRSISLVKKIYTFGKSYDLEGACYFPTLEAVVDDVMMCMQQGDIVLLSPGGSSYDLFEHYEQRGEVFKELVLRYHDSV